MKKEYFLFFILACLSVAGFAENRKTSRKEYIETYKDLAIKHMHEYGIPASITLAQGCLESGDGNSKLAREANNHFGIKCHDWQGPSIRIDDDKRNECFRKYRKAEDSYEDHSIFLRYRDRYSFLFDLEITDYKAWAHGLKKAGYATDPKYASRLIKIIEENELYRYDRETDRRGKERKVKIPSPSELEAVTVYEPSLVSKFYKFSKNRILYTRNNCTYILSNSGDTYASIAKEYKLFKKELLRFNDLKKDRELLPGTIVYLERKKGRAARKLDAHVADGTETYYELSQRYAIRLEKIYEFNEIPESSLKPQKDDVIYLRKHKRFRFL